MLTTLADDFDFEAEQASERMITLIQPLMIIFLAVVICLIIISVLLPIYTLYNNVGIMSYIVFLSTKGLQMVQGMFQRIIFIFLLTKNLNLLKEQC